MLADVRQDKQIAGFGTEPSAVAFFRNAHARTGIDTGRNLDLDLLGFRRHAFAVTQRARLTTAARSFAIGTRLRKLQTSAGPHHLSRAFAGRTCERPARPCRPHPGIANIARDG